VSSKKKVMVKHYNFAMPAGLYEAVDSLAEERNTTFREVLCQFVAFGLSIDVMMRDPSVKLIKRDRDGDTHILWIWNAYLAPVFPPDRSQQS
jgi:hypothetical protein